MIALAFVALVLAPPDLELPTEVHVKPGRLVLIEARTAGQLVRWYPAGDFELIPRDATSAIVAAPHPGRYTLLAWTAIDGEPTPAAVCILVVGESIPPPSPDAFAAALRVAWQAETATDRSIHLAALRALYRETARQPDLLRSRRTWGDLLTLLRELATRSLPADALPRVRAAIAEELRRLLPTDPQATLEIERAVAALRRVADSLEQLS